MKLFELTWGLYPRRVIIYLVEKGITDIERVPLDFLRNQHRDSRHLSRNPASTVPVLELSPGVYIRQSTAILEYLEELYPHPNMMGETSEARAFTRDLMSLINESTQWLGLYVMNSNPLFAGRVEQKKDAADAAWDLYQSRMGVLDKIVYSAEFLNDVHPTIADCSLASLIQFSTDFYNVEVPDCGHIKEWYGRFSARPSAHPPKYPRELLAIARGQKGYA